MIVAGRAFHARHLPSESVVVRKANWAIYGLVAAEPLAAIARQPRIEQAAQRRCSRRLCSEHREVECGAHRVRAHALRSVVFALDRARSGSVELILKRHLRRGLVS